MKVLKRTSFVAIAGGIGAIIVLALFAFSGQTAQGQTAKFFDALARGDAKELAATSYVEGRSQEEIEQEWAKAVERAKYFRFSWFVRSSVNHGPDQATVRLGYTPNYYPGSYDENYQVDVMKVDGQWKVHLPSLSREMYPFLPRW
ncbi:MAG: hypothetical protein R2688_05885 [Fimbriimonadaceae bacterium]